MQPAVPPDDSTTTTTAPLPRVLVADDDPVVRFVLKRLLTSTLKCVVDEAADGGEALRAIAKTDYRLVLLDLRMPVFDGLQTLGQIRSNPKSATLPVVVLSSTRADEVVRQAVRLGIEDYLVKPFTPAVADRLERLLNKEAA
jgi:CheY-like chemotaxis protein